MLPRIESLRKIVRRDNRSVAFFGNGVGNDDEVDRPAPPDRRHLIDRAAIAVAGPGVYAVMDRAEIGRRAPPGPQLIDVKDAKGGGPFGPALIGIDEQQQPATARPKSAPKLGGQVGAGNLRHKVERPPALLRMLGGNRPPTFDTI